MLRQRDGRAKWVSPPPAHAGFGRLITVNGSEFSEGDPRFLDELAVALVGEVVLAEATLLDEPGEEALGQVLRVLGRVALPPHEREDGVPVERAQPRQGLLGGG